MTDELWWTLRKTPTPIYVEYGDGGRADLYAANIKMRKGPPVTIALNLEGNLKTRHTSTGTYVDAQELAEGEIRRLTRLELHDPHALAGLQHHLEHADDTTTPWRLIVSLRGEHQFTVEPEYRDGTTLVLRVQSRLDREAQRKEGPSS